MSDGIAIRDVLGFQRLEFELSADAID